jgi:hypothetical protein
LQTVEADGHPSGGEEEGLGQLRRCSLMGRAGPVEIGENVEISGMAETVGLCDAVQSGLKEVRGANHTSHDFERREIELGPTFMPLPDDAVNAIVHSPASFRF